MKDGESAIQKELRQGKPFRSRRQEGNLALLRTADLLRRAGERLVQPHGITGQQYNVLRILRGAGSEGLPTLEIAERMIEQSPGITRLLDRLDAKKLVRRERCAHDRRQVLCYITPAGRELLERLEEPVNQLDEANLGALSAADVDRLIRILDAIRAAHT